MLSGTLLTGISLATDPAPAAAQASVVNHALTATVTMSDQRRPRLARRTDRLRQRRAARQPVLRRHRRRRSQLDNVIQLDHGADVPPCRWSGLRRRSRTPPATPARRSSSEPDGGNWVNLGTTDGHAAVETVVVPAGQTVRFVHLANNNGPLSVAEIEVLGSLDATLRQPNRAPNTNFNLATFGTATQWPGTQGFRTFAAADFVLDGDAGTFATTNSAPTNGAFVQVDLGSDVAVGDLRVEGFAGGGCNGSMTGRVVVTDSAPLTGQTVAETNASAVRSSAYATFGAFGAPGGSYSVNDTIRFIRVQRNECSTITVGDVRVFPSSSAVMVKPLPDQTYSIGQNVSCRSSCGPTAPPP